MRLTQLYLAVLLGIGLVAAFPRLIARGPRTKHSARDVAGAANLDETHASYVKHLVRRDVEELSDAVAAGFVVTRDDEDIKNKNKKRGDGHKDGEDSSDDDSQSDDGDASSDDNSESDSQSDDDNSDDSDDENDDSDDDKPNYVHDFHHQDHVQQFQHF
ncbi:hypothetical protein H2199_008879 [Coniosporium tulheliwenetii]|uniref:Uncharacterized protein n=1 Tax=Coniosporium tulheliwenetii TaxID=3383036 RepID=A0ACC2YGU6_9PEZI|nr:hypothetical protein H2199_008879 [Cladosporium sp. JES 115]